MGNEEEKQGIKKTQEDDKPSEPVVSLADWKKMTSRAINNTAKLFKPKEFLVLHDFLETVTEKDLQG